MTSNEILNRAAGRIAKHGLARKRAMDGKSLCIAAALVESATHAGKFYDKEYMMARNMLCGVLGISSSYDALADWNDSSFVTKSGEQRYKHTKEDAVKAIYKAVNLTQSVV